MDMGTIARASGLIFLGALSGASLRAEVPKGPPVRLAQDLAPEGGGAPADDMPPVKSESGSFGTKPLPSPLFAEPQEQPSEMSPPAHHFPFPRQPLGTGLVAPASHAMLSGGPVVQGPPIELRGACGESFCDDCCTGWCHKISVFGEFLYLQPRNAEIAYAVPIDGNVIVGPTSDQVQIGPVETVDPDFSPGFRFGFGFTLSECSAVVLTYSQLDADDDETVVLPGGGPVLRSLVGHPNPLNIGADGLDATASYDLQFKLLDADYKDFIVYDDDYQLLYLIGARYANLEQAFDATFSVNGFERVLSNVNFDGAGLRLGIEGERYAICSGLYGYGKAAASFVGGEFRSSYRFFDQADPSITDTSMRANRLVTMLDLELGIGWRNECDCFRLSMGYLISSWHNVVKNNEWINSVQQNNFVDQSDNFNGLLTFDGLTARAEFLW